VHLSALVDGELPAADLELALATLRTPDGKLGWDSYFRIGDEMRAAATPALSAGFEAALKARLDAEPASTRRAGTRAGDSLGHKRSTRVGNQQKRPASNAPSASSASMDGRGAGNGAASMMASDAQSELSGDGKAVVMPKPAIASVS
jgi:sigma-E factor negative regulatory protein RseA